MKKTIPVLLVPALCLWAADFWQTKPYTDWNEKEIQKVETNSPWAKMVSTGMGEGGGGGGTGRGGRGRGGGGGGGDMGGGAGGRGVQEVAGGGGGGMSMTLNVSWRTALPVRQAVAKGKFGKEAATSPDAKKLIEGEQKYYAILVTGLPGRAIRGDKMKEMLLKNTRLSVKGKDPIAPADVQAGGNEQKAVVLFLFPKTDPISLDDKEVEFSTKLGPLAVKQKFHLKEMVFNGKLEL